MYSKNGTKPIHRLAQKNLADKQYIAELIRFRNGTLYQDLWYKQRHHPKEDFYRL